MPLPAQSVMFDKEICFHKFGGNRGSHSGVHLYGLAATNKGRMPYQKIFPFL